MEGPSVVFREHSRVGDVVANDVSVAEFPTHNDETDRTVEVVASRLPVHIEFKLQPIILAWQGEQTTTQEVPWVDLHFPYFVTTVPKQCQGHSKGPIKEMQYLRKGFGL